MRVFGILFALILIAMMIPSSVEAADAYTTTPVQLWVDVPAGSGSTSFKIYISNTSGVDRTFAVTHWYNYMHPNEGYKTIPESWITEFTPDNVTLAPGDELIVNVKVNIPENTPADKYVTWLKVRDDPVSEERPVVVIIRTGASVPTYEYTMEPSFYQLEAKIVADGEALESDKLGLLVKNTGMADCDYRLYVPSRFNVNGEAWRDGNMYQPIWQFECADTIEEMSEIVSIPDPQIKSQLIVSGTNKRVPAYTKGSLPFEVRIPSELVDGYYEARVGVQIADGGLSGVGIGIQYECRLLIHVKHEKDIQGGSVNWKRWIPAIAMCAIFGVGAVGMVVLERRKKNRCEG